MNEEDEAFEDLAKRQGDWGMQGSRKHQIMRYVENAESKGTSMTDKEAMKLALDALETLMIERGSIYEKAIAALKEALAQPEQEPVAWINAEKRTFEWNGPVLWNTPTVAVLNKIPLYTHPPQRKPLTVWEIELWAAKPINRVALCRAIEAAHGIKGNV